MGVSETQFKENYRNRKNSFNNSHQNVHSIQKCILIKLKVHNKLINND